MFSGTEINSHNKLAFTKFKAMMKEIEKETNRKISYRDQKN